jgi:hypothetical protein
MFIMAKNQNQQNQQNSKLVVEITKCEARGKKAEISVLVYRGNATVETELEAYLGETKELLTVVPFRTNRNGRTVILTKDLPPGSHVINIQVVGEKWEQSVVVEIPGEKKSSPFLFVKPNRIKNNLWFVISGSLGSQFVIQDSKDQNTSITQTLNGIYRYPQDGFISLDSGEEYEVSITLLAENASPFYETFRGYADQPLRNREDNWLGLVFGFFSTKIGLVLAVLFAVFFFGIVILPLVPNTAYILASEFEPFIWLANLSAFFLFIVLAVFWTPKIDGRLNNWMWFGWIFWVILIGWLAYSLPSGRGLYEQVIEETRKNDAIFSMYKMSSDFVGEQQKIPGSWLWSKLFWASLIQMVILIPFAYWDEFREAKNRFWEIYQQRGRKIQSASNSKSPTTPTSQISAEGGILGKFWNGIKDEMDSAILAAGVTEAAMYFVRLASRK